MIRDHRLQGAQGMPCLSLVVLQACQHAGDFHLVPDGEGHEDALGMRGQGDQQADLAPIIVSAETQDRCMEKIATFICESKAQDFHFFFRIDMSQHEGEHRDLVPSHL